MLAMEEVSSLEGRNEPPTWLHHLLAPSFTQRLNVCPGCGDGETMVTPEELGKATVTQAWDGVAKARF